ncbi:MAG: dipeptidase [Pseudotabrizicola sp.]|uniref:dipeptidase n=1 Tax=Pseudotabrizicola sp. TaxID=2939647 RepID=UPI00271A7848|nr:dipeptidase [Pseudotabrizicola sp.]MDO8884879.1 dipeptidase [Pseudotabrizicola sp.]MDP2083171.1 dipeptidase [Pseudotabrizicola sp.]MDZ7572588.1 dipeptidase [Pseudotabrizicola sp.]
MTTPTPVFDGHNDLLLRLYNAPGRREQIWLTGEGKGHLDLPRMQKSGFAGGMFAIYVPSTGGANAAGLDASMDAPPYDLPLPAMVPQDQALRVAQGMARDLAWMVDSSGGAFRLCETVLQIEAARAQGIIAGVMHMEGAEAIDADCAALHDFHALGLRSIGPVWSRPTIFGHGVPFRFPGDPDTGPGLTDAGKRLVKECNALKMLIDLSHLNAKGVEDVARISTAPLVATHSNAWAVTPSTRNLTDRQLGQIRDSGGLVGLNFATVFLRPDGRNSPDMTLDPLLRHLDHLISHLGEDHVGFGSDFDGATIPAPMRDVTGLPVLLDALTAHGIDAALLQKLAWGNWMAVLRLTWGH